MSQNQPSQPTPPPPAATNPAPSDRLSDRELDGVSGGFTPVPIPKPPIGR